MAQHLFKEPRTGSTLVFFTCALAFVVILLGAYTRLTDAGLSCPDWPHCFGYLTAPHTEAQIHEAATKFPSTAINVKKAWTEMTHRYFAGTEGLLIFLVAGIILTSKKNRHGKSLFISTMLFCLLCLQVMLGMFTVTAKLKPVIVLAHLLTGLSLLCLLWSVYVESAFRKTPVRRQSASLVPWLTLGFLIVFGQITLGGWVSSHYAGLACIDFPYCNGEVIPTLQWDNFNSDLITIHMAHRLGAFITAIYFLFLSIWLLTRKQDRIFGILFIVFLLLQLTLGILNVIWIRPVTIALFHHAVAILLLLTTLTALIKTNLEARETRYVAWPS